MDGQHTGIVLVPGSGKRAFLSVFRSIEPARSLGIRTPKEASIHSISEAQDALAQFNLLVVLKPQTSFCWKICKPGIESVSLTRLRHCTKPQRQSIRPWTTSTPAL